MNTIAVDIGNSSVKASSGDKPLLVRAKIDELDLLNVFAADSEVNHWLIVSVAQEKTKSLLAWLAANRPGDETSVITNAQIPIKSSIKNRDLLGTDRLIAAYAVNQINEDQSNTDQASVIVDAGTATTIDYVNKQGTFCGGLIFPGVSASLKSLATNTSALPDLDHTKLESATHDIRIGNDTQSAILFGVAQSQAWAILTIAQKMAEPNGANVFLTGGNIELIKNIMPVSWQLIPDLIQQGCHRLFAAE